MESLARLSSSEDSHGKAKSWWRFRNQKLRTSSLRIKVKCTFRGRGRERRLF